MDPTWNVHELQRVLKKFAQNVKISESLYPQIIPKIEEKFLPKFSLPKLTIIYGYFPDIYLKISNYTVVPTNISKIQEKFP